MEVRIAPNGRLWLDSPAHSSPVKGGGSRGHTALCQHDVSEHQRRDLAHAFELSSAAGIAALQDAALRRSLPPSLSFWRGFGQTFFHQLCHFGEKEVKKWNNLPPPDESELASLVESAPPMRGLEYLTIGLLTAVWGELRDLASQQARALGDAEQFLQSVNPLLHLLGRVTFHLAENKQDPSHPFAFMATYTNRVSKHAKLQHLPLAKAIQQYAGEQNRDALQSLLAPIRRAAERDPLVRELLDSKAIFRPQAWTIKQAHRLLQAGPVLEDCGLVLRLPNWWRQGKARRVAVQVQIGKKPVSQVGADALLDFSAQLALDGEKLTADEAQQLLAEDESLVLLRGQWVEVDRQKLQATLDHWQSVSETNPDGLSFLDGMRLIAGVELNESVKRELTDHSWQMVSAGPWLQKQLQMLRDPESIAAARPGKALQANLRPYQEEGVHWLWFLNQLGIGGCLADDMGLGKTIQIIALWLVLKPRSGSVGPHGASPKKPLDASRNGQQKPSLLIVPASLIGNWRREMERFAPSLKAFYAHRAETSGEDLAEIVRAPRSLQGFDVVVTTYGLARRWEWLADVSWRLVVLDEAQAIKNAGSAQTKAIKKLKAEVRFALTGTPVENHLGDLWSLFDFCCPGLLGSATQFRSYVSGVQKANQPDSFAPLKRLVRPYILRRLKSDPQVAPDLPEKTEMRCECALTKKQAALYKRTVSDFHAKLESVDGMARRGLVLSVLMQLKQICNHPSQYLDKAEFDARESGKLQRLAEICEPIIERQEKVLLFTQFRKLTEPVAEFLEGEFRQPGLVLHGGTSVKRRTQLVAEFQGEDGPPFFVISLKAGGSGLNLTAASHVVHFDRWWNPAVENQATDRAFRIGQRRNVLVHKFVCRGTVEEKIDRMIEDKQKLADEILTGGAETALTELGDKELIELVTLDLDRALS